MFISCYLNKEKNNPFIILFIYLFFLMKNKKNLSLHSEPPSPLIYEPISVGSGDPTHQHADLDALFLIGYTSLHLHDRSRPHGRPEILLAHPCGVSLFRGRSSTVCSNLAL